LPDQETSDAIQAQADTAAETTEELTGSVLDSFRSGGVLGEGITDLTIDEGETELETTVTSRRSWFVYVLVAAAIAGVALWYFRARGGGGGGGESVKAAFNRFTEASGNIVNRKAA